MARPRKPYFRASDGWWVSRFNGRYEKLAKGHENKDAAERRFHELHLLQQATRPIDAAAHTVASIIESYLKLNADKYAGRSLEERKRILQAFAEAHGWRAVNDRDCLPVHLEQWIAEHHDWKSDWTRAHVVNVVMRPFNWGVKKRILTSNPFRGVEQAEGEPRRPVTDDEFQRLLRATGGWRKRKRFTPSLAKKKLYPSDFRRRHALTPGARFRQVLVFLRYTGARPGELCGLRWSDLDLERQEIVLQRHKTKKKTKRARIIPMHPVVVKLLVWIKRRGEPGEHVFLTFRKTPWNRSSLSLRMQRAREKAGVPEDAKLYGLRHRFGTQSIVNGVDIKTLAELMGHAGTRMTEHYLHLSGQRAHLADAMRRANARRPVA